MPSKRVAFRLCIPISRAYPETRRWPMRKVLGVLVILIGITFGFWWGQGEALGLRVVMMVVVMMFALPVGLALCLSRFLRNDKDWRSAKSSSSPASVGEVVSIEELERSARQI